MRDSSASVPRVTTAGSTSPEGMRRAMAGYVRAVHQAYLDAAAALAPADRARLPLMSTSEVTVLAVGARNLHVLATTEALPAPHGQEVELSDEIDGLRWRLRFFDPVVVPALGLVDESQAPQPERIRDVLGVRTVVYHLSVPPGGGLTAHHALHAGTGLAHAHAAAVRDYDTIASLAPASPELVAEMRGAEVAGLPRAALLLARVLAPSSVDLAGMDLAAPDGAQVRRGLLAALRATPA